MGVNDHKLSFRISWTIFWNMQKKFLNTFVNHCAKELTQETVKN